MRSIDAYRAGESQATWTFDVNAQVSAPQPLTRPFPHVIDDDLFLGANEHIFLLDPETGQVRHRWDLATLLDLSFVPHFYDDGLNLAVFARNEHTLIISYEARVVAIDRESREALWHVHPRTGSTPFPIVHENQVYMTLGSAAGAAVSVSEDEPPVEAGSVGGSTVASSAESEPLHQPPPVTRTGHCGCMAEPRRGEGFGLGLVVLLLFYVRRFSRR